MTETNRAVWPALLCAVLLCSLAGCASVPVVDGRPATELSTQEIVAAAEARFAAGEFEVAADLAEYVLRADFDHTEIESVRFLAAESLFAAGRLDQAFIHYRRLLDEHPFSTRTSRVADRIWVIGKELLHRPGRFFGDLSALRDVGVEALTVLVTHFPRSDYADDAWKELAVASLNDHHYQAAVDIFERLAREYPESEWCDRALYDVCGAYRSLSRGSKFDVEPLLLARAALLRYLARFPDGNFVEQARLDLRDVEEEIGRHDLEIAEFYRLRGAGEGVRVHLGNAASRFPGTPAAVIANEQLADLPEPDVEEERTDPEPPTADSPPPQQQSPGATADPRSESGERR